MLGRVAPRTDGYGGGWYEAAPLPTKVASGRFDAPGTQAANPIDVPSSGIIEARNNRGSNVRIPYARLVPPPRPATECGDEGESRKTGEHSHSHLRNHELAWILKRKRVLSSDTENPTISDGGRGKHNQMQRLASTSWLKNFFDTSPLKSVEIDLHNLKFESNVAFAEFLHGSNALDAADTTTLVSHALNVMPGTNPARNKPQGIDVFATGPFLKGLDDDSSLEPLSQLHGQPHRTTELPRNSGSVYAVELLESELQKKNLLDWTPDGIVLSRLDPDDGDPYVSTEQNATYATLFNIAVQGPAITTTWTSGTRNEEGLIQCLPMDRVFVCLLADVRYQADKKSSSIRHARATYRMDISKVAREMHVRKLSHKFKTQEFDQKVKEVQDTLTTESDKPSERFHSKDNTYSNKASKEDIRNLEACVASHATLRNFKLRRYTSSYMTTYSRWRPGEKTSRCGLKMSSLEEITNGYLGTSEYIIGGWCVGTVTDSAASRAASGHMVHVAPASMAMNLHVNVEWWSGDKLHKHYMNEGLRQRGGDQS